MFLRNASLSFFNAFSSLLEAMGDMFGKPAKTEEPAKTAEPGPEAEVITAADLKELIASGSVLMVDVRRPDELKTDGYVEGVDSNNISSHQLTRARVLPSLHFFSFQVALFLLKYFCYVWKEW